MKKILALLTSLLFFAGMAMAQATGTSDQNGTAGNQAGTAQTQTQNSATAPDQTQSTTTQTTTTRRHHRGAAAADQNGTAANANGGKLPQTASPLPLLGLLGVGSLGLGVISRKRKQHS